LHCADALAANAMPARTIEPNLMVNLTNIGKYPLLVILLIVRIPACVLRIFGMPIS